MNAENDPIEIRTGLKAGDDNGQMGSGNVVSPGGGTLGSGSATGQMGSGG